MRLLLRSVLLALFSTATATSSAALQSAREPVYIDPSSSTVRTDLRIASEGELSVVAYVPNVAAPYGNELRVSVSNGRGLDWSDPIDVSTDGVTTFSRINLSHRTTECLHIVGGKVYLGFMAETDTISETAAFVRLAVDLDAPVPVTVEELNSVATAETARDFAMDVSQGTSGVNVHFVVNTNFFLSGTGPLIAISSTDGGSTFGAPTTLLANTANAGSVVAFGDRAVTAFGIPSGLRLRSTADAGLDGWSTSSDLAATSMVFSAPILAARENATAVVWAQYDQPVQAALVDVDLDPLASTASLSSSFGEAFCAGFAANGNVIVSAVGDAVTTNADPFVSVSDDLGLSWTSTGLTPNSGIFNLPSLAIDGDNVAVLWNRGADDKVYAVSSLDGGDTFSASVELYHGDVNFGVQEVHAAYNDLYDNVLGVWSADEFAVNAYAPVVGGYRIQTLTPVGFDPALATWHFDLSQFAGGASLGAVFVSASVGSTPLALGPLRDLGLAPDALFLLSVSEIVGALGTSLVSGAGSTPDFPNSLPSGLTMYAVGVSLEPGSGTIGQITDVQEVTTQ